MIWRRASTGPSSPSTIRRASACSAGLSVTGVDSDFTDVGQIVPAVTNGNVITDPGPLGQVDVVSPQTRRKHHAERVTTAVTGSATVVGQWGTLIMGSDGRYSYTPNADTAVLGKTDRFTYTLFDASDGERESATLTISIGSPDITGAPIAVNDVATAAATFVNVVETSRHGGLVLRHPTAIALTGARRPDHRQFHGRCEQRRQRHPDGGDRTGPVGRAQLHHHRHQRGGRGRRQPRPARP